MEENANATIQQQQAAPVPPPPPSHRRPRLRVREVSSRFMSPLVASNVNQTPTPNPTPAAGAESQRSKSAQRRMPQPQQDHELETCSADENFVPETARSLDSSTTNKSSTLISSSSSSAHRKQQQLQPVNKENDAGGGGALTKPKIGNGPGTGRPSSRPDTPIVAGADRDRIIASRYRLASQSLHRPSPATNYINAGGGGGGGASVTATAAAKLLQEATSTDPLISSSSNCSAVCVQNNTNNRMPPSLSDLRSSMPEVDVLPAVSTRPKTATSPCSRSLINLPQFNSEISSSSSWLCLRAGDTTAASTPSRTSVKNQVVASLCLPPHPSSLKPGAGDARKGKKLFNHQEDIKHSLKLLYNHHLQWRFANAKSEASMLVQKMEAERQLYSLGSKISEMHEAVKNRSIELERLQRLNTLSMIVESQMPYLDQWSAVVEDYSHSLSGAIDALLNLSLRLPTSGGVKIDITELKETLDSAVKVVEMIAFRIQSFMVKAEEMESLVSEIARIMSGERAHIQECGDSLLKAYASQTINLYQMALVRPQVQVEECSLRGHLIQLLGRKNCRSHQEQKYASQLPQSQCSILE